jgi:endonuclease III
MRHPILGAIQLARMPASKRSAPVSSTSGTKRKKPANDHSPPTSKGRQLEIGHAPELSNTPSRQVKAETSTPVTPAKFEQLARESPSKMSPSKLKILESLGASPFPDFPHPTHDECRTVNLALTKAHGKRVRPKEFKPGSLGANCGEVPSVLDALVRTVLSQNTNNKNSSTAKRSLEKTFGVGNYQAVREAPLVDVVEALRCGGLANIKGARIKKILEEVYLKYGKLSLDHLHGTSDEDAKRELMQFDGVGPKTASCVLLFCLRRDSFAVDTHVVCPRAVEFETNFSVSNREGAGLGPAQGQ